MRRLLDGHMPKRTGIEEPGESMKDIERRQEAEADAQHRQLMDTAGWIAAVAMLWALPHGWVP